MHIYMAPREQIEHPSLHTPEMGVSVKGRRVAELLLGTRVTFANLVVCCGFFRLSPGVMGPAHMDPVSLWNVYTSF